MKNKILHSLLILQFNIYFYCTHIYLYFLSLVDSFFPLLSKQKQYIKQQTTKFSWFYYFSTFPNWRRLFLGGFPLGHWFHTFFFILFHFHLSRFTHRRARTSGYFFLGYCRKKKKCFISLAMFDSRCIQASYLGFPSCFLAHRLPLLSCLQLLFFIASSVSIMKT